MFLFFLMCMRENLSCACVSLNCVCVHKDAQKCYDSCTMRKIEVMKLLPSNDAHNIDFQVEI